MLERDLRKRVDEHRLEAAFGVSRWVASDLEDAMIASWGRQRRSRWLSAPHVVGRAAWLPLARGRNRSPEVRRVESRSSLSPHAEGHFAPEDEHDV